VKEKYDKIIKKIKPTFKLTIMEEDYKGKPKVEDLNNPKDCGCNADCCPPKKNTFLTKLIFFVIIVAALGIIFVKIFNRPPTIANQQLFRNPNAAVWCDSTATKTCDTTKGSSCCPKSK
jgi:hypothetical protein